MEPTDQSIDIEDFMRVQLRVGRVEHAEAVPKSSKLLRLEVNLGNELGKRQILSGIAKYYTPESMIGKKVVVVSNLKTAKLMGLESQGMLLAASSADESTLTRERFAKVMSIIWTLLLCALSAVGGPSRGGTISIAVLKQILSRRRRVHLIN